MGQLLFCLKERRSYKWCLCLTKLYFMAMFGEDEGVVVASDSIDGTITVTVLH